MLAVAGKYGFQQRQSEIQFSNLIGKRPKVLGKTRPAKSKTGRQVSRRYVEPGIGLEDFRNSPGIYADRVANRTDFVRKSDFQRMKRIAGILDHFRCWNLSFIHAGRKEAVQLPYGSCLNRIARADDCKGRIEEIGNGCT